MKAGNEVDASISEKVMGYTVMEDRTIGVNCILTFDTPTSFKVFRPSVSIADAWLVFDKFKYIELEKGMKGYRCWIYPPDTLLNTADGNGVEGVWGETAPLAICLAALKAHGVDAD